MRLGKMLSVGEVVEQPAAGEPAARPEPARAERARPGASAGPADDDRAQVPAVTGAGR